MLRIPNEVIYTCEKCSKQLRTDHSKDNSFFPFRRRLAINPNGSCKSCNGEAWTFSLHYSEKSSDVDTSLFGICMAVILGGTRSRTTTSTNVVEYAGIPATVVAMLEEDPRRRTLRIAAIASELEQQSLADLGAQTCPTCGVKFVPHQDKPWTQNGYCTRVCDPISAASYKTEPSPSFTPQRAVLSVTCPAGHTFDASSSFSGMTRACPQCGAKTVIQE